MTRSRRTFTAQEKAAVVKRYLVDKTPVSDLCAVVATAARPSHDDALLRRTHGGIRIFSDRRPLAVVDHGVAALDQAR